MEKRESVRLVKLVYRSIVFFAVIGVLFALLTVPSLAAEANFRDASDTIRTMYYTGGPSSDPDMFYNDGSGSNNDLKIEICDTGSADYVGGYYAIEDGSGGYAKALVTYKSSTEAFSPTSGSGPCYESTGSAFTISPNNLIPVGNEPNPEVFQAALPGHLWFGTAGGVNPGDVNTFIYPDGNTFLSGRYSFNRQFNQNNRMLEITNVPTIYFDTSATSSFNEPATDVDWGVGATRPMVLGFCDNTYGINCSDGRLLTTPVFNDLDTGLSAGEVNDQNVHRKFVVMNGLGYDVCIGANLAVTINSVQPNPVYFNQSLEVNITITNNRIGSQDRYGGNVNVTSNFDVTFEIYPQGQPTNTTYTQTFRVNDNLAPNGNALFSLNWQAIAHSGFYTVRLTVDTNGAGEINECVETDNFATSNFELKPITLPVIYIDGTRTNTFPIPNVPYNMSFHLENSDGDILNDATIVLKEQSGLSLSAPTQLYDRVYNEFNNTEPAGITPTVLTAFKTDYYGNVSLVYIPTYNKLYEPEYNYSTLTDYIGAHSLSFYGNQSDGENFKFVVDGDLLDEYPMELASTSASPDIDYKTIANQEIIAQVLDFIYQTYAHFIRTVRI